MKGLKVRGVLFTPADLAKMGGALLACGVCYWAFMYGFCNLVVWVSTL